MAVILLVAAASLFGSYWLFMSRQDGGVWSTTNAGQFVTPETTTADTDWRDSTSTPPSGDVWWLLLVTPGRCDAPCADAMHQLRQLHVLLNKDASRVRRGWVSASLDGERQAASYPKMSLFRGTARQMEPAVSDAVYIVDPHGNLVLRYRLDQVGKPLLNDLKRLLKLSQIG